MIPIEIFETLIGSGGWVGAAMLAIFIGKQLFDAWLAKRRDDREDRVEDQTEVATAVGNASTANAILTKSVETLAAENARLEGRVQHLEKTNDAKDAKIAERDATIESLKANLIKLSDTAASLAKEVTTYQELLRSQDGEVE